MEIESKIKINSSKTMAQVVAGLDLMRPKKDIDQTDLQGLMMEIPSLKEGGEFPAIKRNM